MGNITPSPPEKKQLMRKKEINCNLISKTNICGLVFCSTFEQLDKNFRLCYNTNLEHDVLK